MVHPASCNITGIIPHGNVLAELQSVLQHSDAVSGGMPKIIPLHCKADEGFLELWKTHMEKDWYCMGISGELRFSAPVDLTGSLKELRQQIGTERSVVLDARLERIDMASILTEPVQMGHSYLLWGWKRDEKKAPPVRTPDEGALITVKTFQLAELQLQLSDTGLLTWRTTDSCWACRC